MVRSTITSPAGHRAHQAALLMFPILGLLCSPSLGQEPPPDLTILTSTTWSAAAYSQHAEGTVCWLTAADGSLRLEFQRTPTREGALGGKGTAGTAPELASLLDRTGDGWTLVLGPEGTGTLNAWGQKWRQVPAGLSQLARVVISSLRNFPGRAPDFSYATVVGPSRRAGVIPVPGILEPEPSPARGREVWRFQLDPLVLQDTENEDKPDFRNRMTTRGRGSGGRDEILVLKWSRCSGGADISLSMGSTRRPGTLKLAPTHQLAVATPDPEAWLPLWPLSQFLATP